MNNILYDWPLVIVVMDGFEPRLVAQVIAAAKALDSETLATAWACEAFVAAQMAEMCRN